MPRCMKRQHSQSAAFTLIEILVVLAIVGIIAAILVPVLLGVREKGRRTECLSNMRQINVALVMYVQDADGLFPLRGQDGPARSPEWDDALLPYARSASVFRCPDCLIPPDALSASGTPDNIANGYAFNASLSGATLGPRTATAEVMVPFPATTVSFCEVSFRTGTVPGGTTVSNINDTDAPDTGDDLSDGEKVFGLSGAVRHQGGSDYGFVDGHVRWYRSEQVSAAEGVNGVAQVNTGSSPTFAL